jgi:hypothetical protein
VAVFFLIAGALFWGAYSTYQGVYEMTSSAPVALAPLPPPAEERAFELKLQTFLERLQQGGSQEIRFTAADLNSWIFGNGRNAELANHLRFSVESDWLVANVSVPLTFLTEIPFLPSMRERFFTGKIAARLKVENGELKIQNLDVTGNGKRLPWLFTGSRWSAPVEEGLNAMIRQRLPGGESILSRIEALPVENGEIIVRLRREL